MSTTVDQFADSATEDDATVERTVPTTLRDTVQDLLPGSAIGICPSDSSFDLGAGDGCRNDPHTGVTRPGTTRYDTCLGGSRRTVLSIQSYRTLRLRELLATEEEPIAENTKRFNTGRYEITGKIDGYESLNHRARSIFQEAIGDLPSLVDASAQSVDANEGLFSERTMLLRRTNTVEQPFPTSRPTGSEIQQPRCHYRIVF